MAKSKEKQESLAPINSMLPRLPESDFSPILKRCILGVRDELLDSPYIQEALKVLPVGGYRSAMGSFWNAVVDDLRNKVIHRSLRSFNKEIGAKREIKTYEDFQNYVTDADLIEGAYKIGVIGWEAKKILLHAKQARDVFDGHPKSSEPSILKVLSMMEDCGKYVLKEEYPLRIIDIEDYLTMLGNDNFDRNVVAVENALGDLPEAYKEQLVNQLLTAYSHPDASSILRSNIEFVSPIFWNVLPKTTKIQVVRRVETYISQGNKAETEKAFEFVRLVGGLRYLPLNARRYKVQPLIEKLKNSLDNWKVEDECVKELEPFSGYIPPDLVPDYVSALTHTYVGTTGHSLQFPRTDFYADGASGKIPNMFQTFDDSAAEAFVQCIRVSSILQSRIRNPAKLRRLRGLSHIVNERITEHFSEKEFIEILSDEGKEREFLALIKQAKREVEAKRR